MKTKIVKLSFFVFATIFLMPSCATIMSKRVYPLTVNTTPEGANMIISNRMNEIVYKGPTPATVQLKAASDYFKGEIYTISLEMPGHEKAEIIVKSTEDGWFFGNLVFGGLIGMLIIDPLSGAMYKLPVKEVYHSFDQKRQMSVFDVADINTIPEDVKKTLVRIN